MIRALEEAVWLKDLMEQENQKTSLPFGMDASVYGWNSRSAEVLASMGTSLLTMPWELNSREIEPVLGACRGLGLGQRAYYLWKRAHDGIGPVHYQYGERMYP